MATGDIKRGLDMSGERRLLGLQQLPQLVRSHGVPPGDFLAAVNCPLPLEPSAQSLRSARRSPRHAPARGRRGATRGAMVSELAPVRVLRARPAVPKASELR